MKVSVWICVVMLLVAATANRSVAQTVVRETTQAAESYACPMHAEVTSTQAGKCSKCGMALQPMAAAIPDEFVVQTETEPQRVQVGQKLKLRFAIFHPRTGKPVQQFHIVHEKSFHLFLISHDFAHFEHLHPTQQRDGSFTIETVLPQAGLYHIFCDISPVGGAAQTIHQNLVTTGFKGEAGALQATLTPDAQRTKTVDGLRVTLDFAPESPVAGQPALLRFKLTDAPTGQPVTDLQPYLGAWGHTVILSSDANDYLHSHPLEQHDETNAQRSNPAIIYFETMFPRPGRYRVWSQFQRQHKVVTVFFDVEIADAAANGPSGNL